MTSSDTSNATNDSTPWWMGVLEYLGPFILFPVMIGALMLAFALVMWLISYDSLVLLVEEPGRGALAVDDAHDGSETAYLWHLAPGETRRLTLTPRILTTNPGGTLNAYTSDGLHVEILLPLGVTAKPISWDVPVAAKQGDVGSSAGTAPYPKPGAEPPPPPGTIELTAAPDAKLGRQIIRVKARRLDASTFHEASFSIQVGNADEPRPPADDRVPRK